jgi:phage terminase small subunit
MVRNQPPAPPRGLGPEARACWREITEAYDLDKPALRVLLHACREIDRANLADEVVKQEGCVLEGKDGKKHVHPAAIVSRDARASYLRHLKYLNLDVEPLQPGPGRPSELRKVK